MRVDDGPSAARALALLAWLDEAAALPHHYLANLAFLEGRIDDAVRHERAALARDPDNALYRRNVAALETSRAQADFTERASP